MSKDTKKLKPPPESWYRQLIKTVKPTQPWAPWFGNWAQVSSAVIAAIGFAIVITQISESRQKASDEAYRAELGDARKIYMSYSESTLRYPQLSMPDYDYLMRNHIEYVRYQNFVSHMIYAYDEILNVIQDGGDQNDEDEWLAAYNMDVEPHQRYLCQMPDARFFKSFRPEMQKRLRDANEKNCKDVAPLVELKQ